MIRRISANNDYRDIVRSCPSGVIDDIYAIEYYVKGYDGVYNAAFSKTGHLLEVIIPSSALKTLHSGLLMRRAKYSNEDSSFPDGNYDLEFVESMDVWLDNGNEPGPEPVPGEYVTEEELAETLADYATQDWVEDQGYLTSVSMSDYATKTYVDEAISDIPTVDNAVQYDVDHPLIDDFGLNVDVIKREEFDYETSVMTKGIVLGYEERKNNGEVEHIDTIEVRSGQLWKVHYDNSDGYSEERDPFVLQSDLSSYATQDWVGQQGYASDSDLDALDARVSVLEHGGGPSSVAWGGISGTVTDQTDLVNYIGSQGYVTSSDLSGYATESYVQNQGYITSSDLSTALSSYTVSSKTFVFSESASQSLGIKAGSSINGNSVALTYVTDGLGTGKAVVIERNDAGVNRYVRAGIGTYSYSAHTRISFDPFVTETGMSTALSGYATESYVQNQGYITSSALSGYATESWATNQFLEESKVWSGTQAQWNLLTASQQASYTIALITQ